MWPRIISMDCEGMPCLVGVKCTHVAPRPALPSAAAVAASAAAAAAAAAKPENDVSTSSQGDHHRSIDTGAPQST